jgi:hypothetical protein
MANPRFFVDGSLCCMQLTASECNTRRPDESLYSNIARLVKAKLVAIDLSSAHGAALSTDGPSLRAHTYFSADDSGQRSDAAIKLAKEVTFALYHLLQFCLSNMLCLSNAYFMFVLLEYRAQVFDQEQGNMRVASGVLDGILTPADFYAAMKKSRLSKAQSQRYCWFLFAMLLLFIWLS